MADTTAARRIPAAELEAYISRALVAVGMPASDAAITAQLMARADLNGADFKRRVDALVRDIRGSQRLPGIDAIRLPGEQSHAKREERTRLGIPLPAPLLNNLNQLAADLGIAGP